MTKPLAALAALLLLTPVLPAQAQRRSQGGFATERTCYKDVYREEYTPGTRNNPGRVRRWTEQKEVPCENQSTYRPTPNQSSNVDDNSCVEGSIIGGIAGGAAGGTLATQENWIWSIPAGIIGGAMVGCQVDGG